MTTDRGTIDDALGAVREHLPRWWTSPSQVDRVLTTAEQAVRFANRAAGVDTLEAFSEEIARRFIDAGHPDGAPPSVETRHRRRIALRLLFRAARATGLHAGDPTIDISLPPRSPLHTRPLTADELALCRASAAWSLADTRHAAALALAEATGRTSELASARTEDLDLDGGRVWLHGGGTTAPRFGSLTDWGRVQLKRHVDRTRATDEPLLYRGSGPTSTGQISVSVALADVLRRAGLGGEPDVRPASIAARAGREILEESGRIEVVAQRLGMASLDRAARFIGWDWKEPLE